jgi:hypothetical protein
MNPLSIPGGWSKDKDKSKDSASTEKKNPSKLIHAREALNDY